MYGFTNRIAVYVWITFTLALTAGVSGAERVALVIGNNAYGSEKTSSGTIDWSLKGIPLRDAEEVGKSLGSELGFEVIVGVDLDWTAMVDKLKEFRKAISGAKVVLFYYSGHGAESASENYLIPIDSPLVSPTSKTIALTTDILDLIDLALGPDTSAARIVILDCCRDDPFKGAPKSLDHEGRSGGLASPVRVPDGTIIGFAAQPGKKAAISKGKFSIYTGSLLKFLTKPEMDFELVLRNTGADVVERTKGGQKPWRNSSYNHPLILRREIPPVVLPPVPPTNTVPMPNRMLVISSQDILKRNGIYDGKLDGLLGPKMKKAIVQWQRRSQLSETGEMDDPTLKSLQSIDRTALTNSLGMKFVPVPATRVLFSIWETRVCDFLAYSKDRNLALPEAGIVQTDLDPVVRVSLEDAKAFCRWLSDKERRQYRLPTSKEWSLTTRRKDGADQLYPWGNEFPPPSSTGNFAIDNDKDRAFDTSPVGSYQANWLGLYDLSGNVWEICDSVYDPISKPDAYVVRGGGWGDASSKNLESDFKWFVNVQHRESDSVGFRVVVEADSPGSRPSPPTLRVAPAPWQPGVHIPGPYGTKNGNYGYPPGVTPDNLGEYNTWVRSGNDPHKFQPSK